MPEALSITPRGLMSLLFNGERARDVLEASHSLGLFRALESPISLGELAARSGFVPLRLYKLLDCLETLGVIERQQDVDAIEDAVYRVVPGVPEAVEAVFARGSQERDRESFDWRALHGKLPAILSGRASVPESVFRWPMQTDHELAEFEASMEVGLGPIRESFERHPDLFCGPDAICRLLDVGGGNGALAAFLLRRHPNLRADVFNLEHARGLVDKTRRSHGVGTRLGFVGGDFLRKALPGGYDAISFVRTLHDWPADTARQLMEQAYRSLPPGGWILICEEFRTRERLAAQFFWTYFLIGVDSCVSRLREVEFYEEGLTRVGFREVQTLGGGPFELVVGRR